MKYYKDLRRRGISYKKKGRLTVWITVLVGTAFEFKLLKER
jgi:hypothetical protein